MGIILAGKHRETYSELHMVLTILCHTKDSCSSKMMMLIRSTQIIRFTRFYFAKTYKLKELQYLLDRKPRQHSAFKTKTYAPSQGGSWEIMVKLF